MLKIKKDDFVKNQVIWGKISGYPWWPCFIKDIKQEKIEVCYLGDFSRSFLKKKFIKNFSEIKKPFKPGKKLLKSIKIAERIINGISSVDKELEKAEIIFEEKNLLLDSDLKTEDCNIFEVRKIDSNRKIFKLSDKEETGDENNFKCLKKKIKKNKVKKEKKICFEFPQFLEKKNFKIGKENIKNIEKDLDFIKNIEMNFENLLQKIIEDFNFFLDMKLFEKIFCSIYKLNNKLLYNSKIGKYINFMIHFFEEHIKENKNIENIYNYLKLEIEKIREKLILGFFEFKEEEKILNSENYNFQRKKLMRKKLFRKIQIKNKFKNKKKKKIKKKKKNFKKKKKN